MSEVILSTCIEQMDIISKANEMVMNAQIQLKEKLIRFNSAKEQEFHNKKSNKDNGNCKKS